MNKQAG